ncbi:MAG: Zn-dependent hydrolase [Nitrospinota bacterium]|nr:MAG: Zn-dependent hydrolase [Nitrospinota bacterium]
MLQGTPLTLLHTSPLICSFHPNHSLNSLRFFPVYSTWQLLARGKKTSPENSLQECGKRVKEKQSRDIDYEPRIRRKRVTGRVSQERLQAEIERFAQIGRTAEGGVTRLAFSPEERQAQQLMGELLAEAGLSVRTDAIGNLFARREGREADLPVLMLGSHLDTVPNGGRFDGALGVIAGLEIMRVLQEQGISTRHPLEVVSFTGEESARFGTGTIGSRAMLGTLNLERFLASRDLHGISAAEAMRQVGLSPEKVTDAQRDPRQIAAFLELHIEQGRILETEQKAVGIVTDIANSTRLAVQVIGRADHSGTTPMPLRKDALVAAAEMVLAVEERVKALGEAPSVGTVGILHVEPCVMNVVPGKASLGIDIRDIDFERKARVVKGVKDRITAIAKQRGVEATIEVLGDGRPVALSPVIIETMRQAAADLGIDARIMVSGAGHDAMNLATVVPAGMIFVPSKEGRSHSHLEWTDFAAIPPGVELLLETLLRLDRSL